MSVSPTSPRTREGIFSSALALQKAGDTAAAEKHYRELLAEAPDFVDAWNNLGVLLQRAGRGEEALDCLDRVAALQPEVARGHLNRGAVLKALGRIDEAIAAYRRALELAPDDDGAHGNLGNLLFDEKRYQEALPHYASASRIDPKHAGYRLMQAKTLLECGRHEEAAAEFHAALALESDATRRADAWGLLARIAQERHDLATAIACFDRGATEKPDYDALRYNRGLAKLLAGDLPGGFADYERRFDVPGFPGRRMAESHPLWQGEPLPGKTLFLYAEQGLGDTVQFMRFLPLARERAGAQAKIVVAVQTPLRELFRVPDGVEIVSGGDKMPTVDAVCPLMSLPHRLGTDLLSIPTPPPWLIVDGPRSVSWHNRLSAHRTKLRIGLVWAGNPQHSNDANRSMPLDALRPLLELPGVQCFSLQVGARAADLKAARLDKAIVDLAPHLDGFRDTAAAISQLDLLLCVDTSVAHIAGALGAPAWLMLPHQPDWRWLLHREDTPWYPSLRLFRQPRPGDWAEVVARIASLLAAFAPGAEKSRRPASADFSRVNRWIEAARIHLERGEAAPAEALCWQALREHPFHTQAWNLLAVSAWRRQDAESAILYGARAARFNATDAANWSNLGAFLKAAGRLEEACQHQQRAVELAPDNAGAQSNLGNSLAALGRFDEAIAAARRAIALAPHTAEYHYNLGVILREVEDFDAALDAFRAALRLDPGHVRAQLHIALLELMLGDFARGWVDYECRWLQPDCKEVRHFNRPQWTGEDIAGKRILIHAEQGFGDSFQFLRYLPLVAAKGAEVALVVQPSLESFAQRIPGVKYLIPSGEPLPPCDLHCPLLSLPRALGTTLETIPAEIPYLRPLPEKTAYWRERLAPLKAYRVGLVWAGRPTHGNDMNRSMALAQFAALLSDPRFDFVSLQKGPATAQIATLPEKARILDLDAEIESFEDTAAILCELDELLTVDTSVAHLAGALGVKTRVLLPRLPDWRWLWNRADSPWYPTLTLYRQDKRKDWSGPLVRVAKDLRAAAKQKKG